MGYLDERAAVSKIPTTRWSLVLQTSNADPELARRAVSALCEAYWYPVYLFYRRARCNPEAARETAQELFADLIERNDFARADPRRGRFRDYLLGAARHLLANTRRRARSREGREVPFFVDCKDGETRVAIEPASDRTPESEFRAAWAREVVSRAIEGLASEYEARGDLPLFRRLVPYLVSDGSEPAYSDLSAAVGKNVGTVRMAVTRLRERFRRKLRDQVSTYTADEEVEEELRFLLASLNPGDQ